MAGIPSFGISISAPFDGVIDKDWTKFQSYPEFFRSIIANTEPGKPTFSQEIPYEEAVQVRLNWYNTQRFVRRSTLKNYFTFATSITSKIIRTTEGRAYLEFFVDLNQSAAQLAMRRIDATGGARTTPPVAQLEERPLKPLEDPRVPPDFVSQEQMQRHFSAETYEARRQKEEKAAEIEKMLSDREQHMKDAIEVQDSINLFGGTYDRWKRRYTLEKFQELLNEDTSLYRENVKLDNTNFFARDMPASAMAKPSKGPSIGLQKLTSITQEDLDNLKKDEPK